MKFEEHHDSEYGGFAHITEGEACCVFCLTIFHPGLAWLVNACKDRFRIVEDVAKERTGNGCYHSSFSV